MTLLDQFPRLSAYDPGATGEGGLDPLGLASIADRIADNLAPGIRARMINPRFVTLSAIGAFIFQDLQAQQARTNKAQAKAGATADIAFEWLVVEAMIRYPGEGRLDGLPGSQKAARAKAANHRLSPRTYLSGPRVFGFTGVYRPLSRDTRILSSSDTTDENTPRLVSAWEQDFNLTGYIDRLANTPGGKLRQNLQDECAKSVISGQSECPLSGDLLKSLASYLAPGGAKAKERRVLRELITKYGNDTRQELSAWLVKNPLSKPMSQLELAQLLLQHSSPTTKSMLQASIDYEELATSLDNTFKRFLAHTVQQSGAIISPTHALDTPGLAQLGPKIGGLVRKAIDSLAKIGMSTQAQEIEESFADFQRHLSPQQFFDAMIARHEHVQAEKKKLTWIDQLGDNWTVRTPYRNHSGSLDNETWTHPMRLVTLANLIAKTA